MTKIEDSQDQPSPLSVSSVNAGGQNAGEPNAGEPNAGGLSAGGLSTGGPLSAGAAGAGGSRVPAGSQLAQVLDGKMAVFVGLLFLTGILSSGQLNERVRRWFVPTEPVVTYNLNEGAETELDLTVIAADARRLTCASDKAFAALHCAYQADKKKLWPRAEGQPVDDNQVNIIQPYRTAANNQLVLVAGVWAQPAVATRVHQELPEALEAKKQARFTARCKVKIVGKFDEVWVRWESTQQWYKETNPAVAQVLSCTVDR